MFGEKYPKHVIFSTNKLGREHLNYLYNLADVQMLLTSNEGWGLTITEAILSGTPIIANTTGGMQDQMRFVDENNKWVELSADFPSNHRGTYKKCGEWAIPIFPANVSLQGSPLTPYIFDERCAPEQIAEALLTSYNMNLKERRERGLKGREWALSDEAGFTSQRMTQGIVEGIEDTIKNFTPRKAFDLIEVKPREPKYVKHQLTNY